MDNRTNIIAMMALGAMIVALGGAVVSAEYFSADRPEKMGYVVEGVEAVASEGGEAAQVAIATLLPTADVAKGAEVFKKCASCHSINAGGANGTGPNIHGILGKPHAAVAGFAYSEALKAKAGPWTFDEMDAWLLNPRKYAAGTKMSFAGLSKPEDRANVIAYMNSQGSNLPLPAVTAAAPASGAQAGAPGGETAPIVNEAKPGEIATTPTKTNSGAGTSKSGNSQSTTGGQDPVD